MPSAAKRLTPSHAESWVRVNTPPCRLASAIHSARRPVNVSRQVPVPPGIFVIWDGMGLVAKRIEHVPHSEPPRVVLKSLNPEYDSYERPAEEVRVVARAVWVSRRL